MIETMLPLKYTPQVNLHCKLIAIGPEVTTYLQSKILHKNSNEARKEHLVTLYGSDYIKKE